MFSSQNHKNEVSRWLSEQVLSAPPHNVRVCFFKLLLGFPPSDLFVRQLASPFRSAASSPFGAAGASALTPVA